MKSMKEKSSQTDKDSKEGSTLQIAGPSGEITAGAFAKDCCFVWYHKNFICRNTSQVMCPVNK